MTTNHQQHFWQRAIIFVDMNAFFASIEQLDDLQLRAKPIAVTNGKQGTCIITCSYEARRFGIKTGMRLKQARQLCPSLIQCPSRPTRYAQVSMKIMQALQTITPDVEVFSVDEAFLDVTHCQRLLGEPVAIAKRVKQIVYQVSHLPCSIGVSANKAVAKFAGGCEKPDGFTVIEPWQAKIRLQNEPVTKLCGVGEGISRFLAQYGAKTCGEVTKLPISILATRFGNMGRRIWLMCEGTDPEPLQLEVRAPKSMGHSKVTPPELRDKTVILTYLMHMSEKLATRLRHHGLQAQLFAIGLLSQAQGWLGGKYKLVYPSNDGQHIYHLVKVMMNECWQGQAIGQVKVMALDPRPALLQQDLFQTIDFRRMTLNQMIDTINDRYGEFSVAPARLLNRSPMPNVIAPAWKPAGHRQTIQINTAHPPRDKSG